MKDVLIFGYLQKPEVKAEIEPLLPLLQQHARCQQVDLAQKSDTLQKKADLAIVFGGDGTMLRAAAQMGYHQVPTVGINLGKLGFLADLNREDAAPVLTHLFQNGFAVSEHMMFECIVTGPGGRQTLLGLNELVVHVDPPLHLVDIDLAIDGEPVATFTGDGLILSTPIGSTGHNLSAGGPILRQEIPAFVITPICPHALTYRSLVDGGERIFTITLRPGSHPARIIVDGQEHLPITQDHRIVLKQAQVKFKRVRVPGRSYYTTLREKLHWAAPPSYRTDPANHP